MNLSSFIRFHALRTPDAPAVLFQDLRISYAELMERIEKLAGWLALQEIGAGDVVAVLMKNSAAFVDMAFAVSHAGAVFLPINFRLSADEVEYIVENAGARLLVVDEELSAATPKRVRTVIADSAAQRDSRLLAGDAPAAAMTLRAPSNLFRLMYTSGTTDRPKGVMHTYDNFYWKSAAHAVSLGLNAQTRLLVAGPLYHVGAFDLPGMAVLWHGGTIAVHRDFEPAAILSAIERDRLNAAWLAPVMTGMLLAFPDRRRFDVSSIEWVIGGGERTPESRIRAFSEYFTRGRYIDGYGLTESSSGDTLMEAGREVEKIGSTGRAVPHVEISIRDEDRTALAPGSHGEICLRGPKVTSGYWKDAEKTRSAFVDGWFRTGDVGYLDEEGFLFLTDRKKDMIISGGENIASSEVERVLYEMPEIAECAVLGAPDERWGEKPVAFVVLKPGATLAWETLAVHCRTRLAPFKIPKEMVIRETLPRNPSGKVLKRELRQELLTAAERINAEG